MEPDGVLTSGQREALLHGTPADLKRLVYKLAVHHGAIERPEPADCPLCGQHSDQQERTLFSAV